MIAVLLDVETLRTVAPLAIAAAMTTAFLTLAAAVRRTSSDRSRHARLWSPPRPWRAIVTGRHSKAHRRRAYATTRAKHTTVRTAA